MSYRTRKLLALLILMVGLPLYVYAAMMVMSSIERPSFIVELGVYIGLGILWALPFRKLFLGIAKPPDAEQETER